MIKQSKLASEKEVENEVIITRDVSQLKLIRDREQISEENLY